MTRTYPHLSAGERAGEIERTVWPKRLVLILLLLTLGVGQFISPVATAKASAMAEEYVCPPCGCGSDERAFDKPGVCSVCGMALIVKGSQAAAAAAGPAPQAPKKVAILIFDGVQIIDYTGPYEVFGAAGLQVFTVATSAAAITTNMGMKVTPHYTLDDAPPANVLLIPGGGVFATQADPRVLKWIQERSAQAEYVMSVCNGAAILAKTGLLDGLTATTTAGLIDGLPAIAPKVKVVRDRRYVDNGKFITTGGLSSGIDGALYVVSKIFGKARAQLTALREEYDWKGDSNYARASLADRFLTKALGPRLALPVAQGDLSELLSTEGTSQSWELKWQVVSEATPADVMGPIRSTLAAAQWAEQKSAKSGLAASVWSFRDGENTEWRALVEAQRSGSKIVNVSLKIERASTDPPKRTPSSTVEEQKITVRDARIQEMPRSSRATAAHMIIENSGDKETALIGARAGIAGAVELHRAEMDNGMMRMRKLDRINLQVGKTDLTGELHIMLIDLKTPLKEGDVVALTLDFEGSLSKTVMVPVKKRQAE